MPELDAQRYEERKRELAAKLGGKIRDGMLTKEEVEHYQLEKTNEDYRYSI